MPHSHRDVLIVDDDKAICRLLVAAFNRAGLNCDTASDGAAALDQIRETLYSVVLVDLMMPRMDGAEFVAQLAELEAESTARPVVLMMTAFPARERLDPLGHRIQAVIQKPFDVMELADVVQGCVEARKLYDVNAGREEGTLPFPGRDVSRDSRH